MKCALDAPASEHAARAAVALSSHYVSEEVVDQEGTEQAARLLVDWLPSYTAEFDAEGEALVAHHASRLFVFIAQTSKDTAAEIACAALREMVAEGHHDAVATLAEAMGERVVNAAPSNDPVAKRFVSALLAESPEVDQAWEAVAAFLKDSLTAQHASASPESVLALAVVREVIDNDELRDKLAELAPSWLAVLTQPALPPAGRWEHAANALAASAALLAAKNIAAFETRLRLYANDPAHREHALEHLVNVPWPEALRAQAVQDIAANWSSLSAALRELAAARLGEWPEVELQGGLNSDIVQHIVDSGAWYHLAAFWPRLGEDDHTALVLAGAGREDGALAVARDATEDELVRWLIAAHDQERLVPVARLLATVEGSSAAARKIVEKMSAGTELDWSDKTVENLIALVYRDDEIQAEYADATTLLGQGTGALTRAIRVLRALGARKQPVDRADITAALADAIGRVSDDAIATELVEAAKACRLHGSVTRKAYRKRSAAGRFMDKIVGGD